MSQLNICWFSIKCCETSGFKYTRNDNIKYNSAIINIKQISLSQG